MGKTANYNLPFPEATDKANVPLDIQKLAEAAEAALENKVNSEIGKRLMTNTEGEKLASLENYDDLELKKIIDNQSIEIGYLNKVKKQILEDYKKIPFNSSSNHLEDTGELPILDLGINGGIEQDSRNGDNLLDIRNAYEVTKAGVTLTVDKEKQEITLNGTCDTDNTAFALNVPLECVAGAYTRGFKYVSGSVTIPSGKTSSINLQDSNWVGFVTPLNNNDVFTNQTISSDLSITYTVIRCDSGCVYNNFKIKPFLASGKDKAFEIFGQMPSLDFPGEVKGVSGHYDTVVENKNLYDYKNAAVVTQEVTVDNEGWITMSFDNTNGTSTKFLNYFSKRMKSIKNSKNYNIVTEIKSVNGTGSFVVSSYDNGVGQFPWTGWDLPNLKNNTVLVNERTPIPNQDQSQVGLRSYLYIGAGQSGSITFRVSVLEDLTVTAENFEYTPHQEQTFPIDLPTGKVLYNEKAVVELTDAEIEELGLEKAELYFKDEFGKQEINNSLTITRYVASGFDCYRITGLQNLNNSANAIIKSNIFEGIVPIYGESSSITNRKAGDIYINNVINAIDMLTKNGEYADATSFINAVTGNYFVYQLAKPIYTPIKDENFIKQYRALQKAHSYKEVTNINSYGSNAEMKVSGNALMSNDIRLSKLENAVLSIGGNV